LIWQPATRVEPAVDWQRLSHQLPRRPRQMVSCISRDRTVDGVQRPVANSRAPRDSDVTRHDADHRRTTSRTKHRAPEGLGTRADARPRARGDVRDVAAMGSPSERPRSVAGSGSPAYEDALAGARIAKPGSSGTRERCAARERRRAGDRRSGDAHPRDASPPRHGASNIGYDPSSGSAYALVESSRPALDARRARDRWTQEHLPSTVTSSCSAARPPHDADFASRPAASRSGPYGRIPTLVRQTGCAGAYPASRVGLRRPREETSADRRSFVA